MAKRRTWPNMPNAQMSPVMVNQSMNNTTRGNSITRQPNHPSINRTMNCSTGQLVDSSAAFKCNAPINQSNNQPVDQSNEVPHVPEPNNRINTRTFTSYADLLKTFHGTNNQPINKPIERKTHLHKLETKSITGLSNDRLINNACNQSNSKIPPQKPDQSINQFINRSQSNSSDCLAVPNMHSNHTIHQSNNTINQSDDKKNKLVAKKQGWHHIYKRDLKHMGHHHLYPTAHFQITQKDITCVNSRGEVVLNMEILCKQSFYSTQKQNLTSKDQAKYSWIGDITRGNDYHRKRISGHIKLNSSVLKTELERFKPCTMDDGNQWCLVSPCDRPCAFSLLKSSFKHPGYINLEFKFACQKIVNGHPEIDRITSFHNSSQMWDRRFVRLNIHLVPVALQPNKLVVAHPQALTNQIISLLNVLNESFFKSGYGSVIARDDLAVSPGALWNYKGSTHPKLYFMEDKLATHILFCLENGIPFKQDVLSSQFNLLRAQPTTPSPVQTSCNKPLCKRLTITNHTQHLLVDCPAHQILRQTLVNSWSKHSFGQKSIKTTADLTLDLLLGQPPCPFDNQSEHEKFKTWYEPLTTFILALSKQI